MKNTTYTTKEYKARVFTKEEVEKVRRSYELFNNWGNLTEEEKQDFSLNDSGAWHHILVNFSLFGFG